MSHRFISLVLAATLTLSVSARADDEIPADIAALLEKSRKGQTLTDGEMTKVIDWQREQSKKTLDQQRAKFTKPPSQRPPSGPPPDMPPVGDVDDATPTIEASLNVTKRKKLDQAAYKALVAKIAAKDREFLGKDRADAIKKAATKQPLIVASALTVAGDGAGALYATTIAATAGPKDPFAANALGVALQAANMYGRSWDVLVYADSLAKDDATIQSNLGYAAMYLGDGGTSFAKFSRALQLDPTRPEPNLGLGLLAKGQGDIKAALPAFRAAVARGSSEVATQMVDIVAVQSEPTSGNNDPVRAARQPIGDDPGFKAGGALVIDLKPQHRTVFPLWTPPADAGGVAAFSGILADWIAKHQNDVSNLHNARMQARDDANAAIAGYLKAHSKDGITIPMFDTRVITILDDFNVVYQARVREALRPFDEARMKGIKDAMNLAMSKKCEDRGGIIRQLNASLGGAYAPAATKVKSVVEQYFRETDPYIDSIWQADLQKSMQLQRRELLALALLRLREGMAEWSGSLSTVGCSGGAPPPKDGKKAGPTEDPQVSDPTPGKCPIKPGHKSWGVISIDYSCEGVTIQGGEGLFGGIDIQFKGPSGHMEQKLFIGVGAEGDFGPAKGEGKAVIWITKAGGHVVDVGAEYAVSGKVEAAGQSAEGSMGLSASWRAGPNMSGSGKATLFGTTYTGWNF